MVVGGFGGSPFLVGRTWVIVVTAVFDGTSVSCPYDSSGDGGDSGPLTGYRRMRGRFEVVSEFIIGVVFGDSFSVYGDYDKYRFLQYVFNVMTYEGFLFGFTGWVGCCNICGSPLSGRDSFVKVF